MKSRIEIAREIAEKVHLEPNEKYPEGQKDKKEKESGDKSDDSDKEKDDDNFDQKSSTWEP